MNNKRKRLASVLKVARRREEEKTAQHHDRLREIDNAKTMFIAAQNRASEMEAIEDVGELQRYRDRHTASARSALAAEAHLADQIERSVEERNSMLAAMRHRRTIERIDEKHAKAWAVLAAQSADRTLDDIAAAGWMRRQK